MAAQWLLGFIGSYILASLLLYPFMDKLSTPVEYLIALGLALAGAGLRVRVWQQRQRSGSDSL